MDRRVVGWSAGRHVDHPCGGQISPWPARKDTDNTRFFRGSIQNLQPKWPSRDTLHSDSIWKAANGGAKRIVRFWGGKRTIECAFQNQFWRPQKVGFAWSEPVSSEENSRTKTNGGGKRIIGGGVQNRFWERILWYVFPSPEFFHPPLFFSDSIAKLFRACF